MLFILGRYVVYFRPSKCNVSKTGQDGSWNHISEIRIITDLLLFHIYLQQQTYKLEMTMDTAVESFISFTRQSLSAHS